MVQNSLGRLFRIIFLDTINEDCDYFWDRPRSLHFLLAFPMCSVALALTFKKSIVLEKNPKQYLTQWELGGLSNTDRVGFRNGIWMLVKF